MQNLPCEVIRDLLPSYVDGLTSETLQRACRLNKPVYPFSGAHGFESPVAVDNGDVRITLLKKAYRGDAIAVRLYESQGKPAEAALTVQFTYREAYETDLLEENRTPVDPAGLTFRPFEIKTILFVR